MKMNKLFFLLAILSLTACSSDNKAKEEAPAESSQTSGNNAYVKKYDFTSTEVLNHVSLSGFSDVEPGDGIWTSSNEAVVDMPWNVGSTSTMILDLRPFVTDNHKINVEVYIEDNLYDIWKFEKESPTSKYIFIKPSDVTDDVASIRFAIDSPKTPAELGINSDTRKLGLFFEKITVFGFKE